MSNPITSIRDYFKSSIAELKKVTWPSRQMTMRYAALVIIVSAALAAFFAALDFGLSRIVTLALERKPPAQAAPAPEAAKPDLEPAAVETAATSVGTTTVKPDDKKLPASETGGFTLPPLEPAPPVKP